MEEYPYIRPEITGLPQVFDEETAFELAQNAVIADYQKGYIQPEALAHAMIVHLSRYKLLTLSLEVHPGDETEAILDKYRYET